MAFRITYQYKNQPKEIGFANDKHLSVYDAIAQAEKCDLSKFHDLEKQLAHVSRNDNKTMKDFREGYFRELGFTHILINREGL